MTLELFPPDHTPAHQVLGPGAVVLRAFAWEQGTALLHAVAGVVALSPFRNMVTPSGFRMAVGMTNCGAWGWVTDAAGYRYAQHDPASARPWPPIPALFLKVATSAAAAAGYAGFAPDACLMNRYEPGARMSLHQDKNERDFTQPIVSVSLGVPAVFQWGGVQRADKAERVRLLHGDVVVWGGPARLRFHGVLPLKVGHHPETGNVRINLTFRTVV